MIRKSSRRTLEYSGFVRRLFFLLIALEVADLLEHPVCVGKCYTAVGRVYCLGYPVFVRTAQPHFPNPEHLVKNVKEPFVPDMLCRDLQQSLSVYVWCRNIPGS